MKTILNVPATPWAPGALYSTRATAGLNAALTELATAGKDQTATTPLARDLVAAFRPVANFRAEWPDSVLALIPGLGQRFKEGREAAEKLLALDGPVSLQSAFAAISPVTADVDGWLLDMPAVVKPLLPDEPRVPELLLQVDLPVPVEPAPAEPSPPAATPAPSAPAAGLPGWVLPAAAVAVGALLLMRK